MPIDRPIKSNRLLQSKRYTQQQLGDAQEAFTSVLDINSSEVYAQQDLIPTSSLIYSGSSQNGQFVTASGYNVLKFYYRQRLVPSDTLDTGSYNTWFFLDPTASIDYTNGVNAGVLNTRQQGNFISPKYAPALGGNTEDITPGYQVKLTDSTGTIIDPATYTFDYKDGVLQFNGSSGYSNIATVLTLTAYQYVGKTLGGYTADSGSFDTRINNITGSFSTTASLNGFTASINNFSASVLAATASLYNATASLYNATASLYNFSASINAYTSSNNNVVAQLYNETASLRAATASINLATESLNRATASLYNATSSIYNATASIYNATASLYNFSASVLNYTASQNILNGTYATTASNTFIGNQTITGSVFVTGSQTITGNLTVTDTITAQKLVVQTISSSIIYSSGSNKFGNNLTDTQQLTGSVEITGSLLVNGRNYINDSSSFSTRTLNLEQTSASVLLATASIYNATASLYNFSASILNYTSSTNATIAQIQNATSSIYNATASLYAASASINAFSASMNAFTASQRVLNGTYATTGSNVFKGNQVISGSLTVSGSTDIFGTTNVTGSVNVSGSTGTAITANVDTIVFTGSYSQSGSVSLTSSVDVTGSLTVNGRNYINDSSSFSIRTFNLEQTSASVLLATASFNAATASLYNATASLYNFSSSILNYTASNNATITQLYNETASLRAASASINLATESLNRATASLYNATASIYNATASLYNFSASINAYTASNNETIAQLQNATASIYNATASLYAASASMNAFTASQLVLNGTYATTGSNIFIGTQTITGSLLVTGSTVQTGNNTLIGNTVLSGSVNISGSTSIRGTTNFSNSSTTITGSLLITGSTTQIGNNTLVGNTLLTGSLIVSGTQGLSTPTIGFFGDVDVNGVLGLNPISSNINNSLSGSYIYVSGSTQDLYFTQNGQGYSNTTRLRWLESNLYTGLLSGGIISASLGSTSFTITSGSAIIVSMGASTGSADPYPTTKQVRWGNITTPLYNSASAQITYVGIDGNGAIVQQTVPWGSTDVTQWDTQVELGVVLHLSGSVVTGVYNSPQVSYGQAQQNDDFTRAFGPIKISGHTLSPSGSSPTLSLKKAGGLSYNKGANYVNDPNHPSTVTDPSVNASKIYRYYISGSTPVIDSGVGGAGYTTIDNTKYVDTATGNLATVGSSNWSIQRVFWIPNSPTNAFLVYYGNARYGTLLNAVNAKDSEQFTEAPNTAANAIFLGYIIIQGGANRDLLDPTDTTIIPGGLFRSVGGVASSGTAPTSTTLEGLADVSAASRVTGDLLYYNGALWVNSKTLTGNYNITGSLTVSAGIGGDLTGTASYATNANLLDGLDSTAFVSTGSFGANTASFNNFSASINLYTASNNANIAQLYAETASLKAATASLYTATASLYAASASINAFTASINSYTSSNNATIAQLYAQTASILAHTASINAFSASINAYTSSNNNAITSLYNATASLYAATASIYNTTASLSSSIAILSGSFLSASASFDTRINSLTESVFTHVVTSNGASNYIIDGVAKPMLSFVPGATYRFDTTAVGGSHPFRFSTSPNGPTQYTVGVTSGSNYIQIEVNYDTPTLLYYYCTIHSGMGNEIDVLRIENLVTTASFNEFSSSILNYTASQNILNGTYTTTSSFQGFTSSINATVLDLQNATASLYAASASINAYTASQNILNGKYATTSSNTFEGVQTINSNLIVTGSITAQSLFVQTITSSVDFVTGSTRFGTITSNTHQFTGSVSISGSLAINGVNYEATSASFDNRINAISGAYLTSASFQGFTASINAFSASILSYTASQNILNGTYANTASFNAFSASVNLATASLYAASASINNFSASMNAFTASQRILNGTYATTGSNTFRGTETISGSLLISGSGTILSLNTDTLEVTGSLIVAGTSSLSGLSSITGSLGISGSTTITGSINVSGSVVNNLTASHAITASYWSGSIFNAVSASFAQLARSASFAETASFALNAGGGGGGGLSALYIQDEGITQGTASYIDFVGNGVTATVSNGTASINIPGGAGSSQAGGNSVLTQSVANVTWSFTHNLNTQFPVFTIFDSNNDVIIPNRINAVNTSSALIYFSSPRTGYAVASQGGNVTTASYALVAVSASFASTASFVRNAQSASYWSGSIINAATASYVQNAQSASYWSGSINNVLSASYAATSSYSDRFTVGGTLTAQTLVVQTISSSVIYSSGSNVFGNDLANTQKFTGSVDITGSLALNGSNVVLTNQTSSMSVLSASFASTASYVGGAVTNVAINAPNYDTIQFTYGNGSQTNLTINNVGSASFASTASYWSGSIVNATTASFVQTAQTASFVQTAQTASFVQTAQTASYVLNAQTASFVQTAQTASFVTLAQTASFVTLAQTASFVQNAISASYSNNSTSASYALTASFALNGGGGGISAISIADEGLLLGSASYFDFTGAGVSTVVNAGTASFTITGGGGSGTAGLTTTMTQSVAAVSWSFNHNLNTRFPLVQVYDTSYNQVTPQFISSSDATTVIIGFGIATAGYAVASMGGTLVITGSNVIFDQPTAAATWSFTHNLNTQYPVFQVFDTNNEVIVPTTIKAIDSASALIYFPLPVAGKAVAVLGGISGSGGSGAGFPFSGSAVITGSFLVSGSFADFTRVTNFTGSLTGSLLGTASYALNSPGYTVQFSQSVAAATWSFTHNMGTRNPIVQVYDSTYKQIIPNEIVGIDGSTAQIRFDYAQSGYAVMSNGGGLYITGSTSTLIQTSAATTWSFNHRLNTKYPAFEVYDSNDFVIIPANIRAVDVDNAELHFASAQTGRAIANFSGINGLQDNAVSASYAASGSVFHVDKVVMDRSLMDYAQVNSSIVGSNNMFTQATGSYTSMFVNYTVASGSNARSGQIIAVWNAGTTEYNDVSTNDIGNTTAVTGSVSIVSGEAQLNFQTNTSGWRIKSTATFM